MFGIALSYDLSGSLQMFTTILITKEQVVAARMGVKVRLDLGN